ncbi:DUF4214 domain-containing protein [Halomonas litopenaei]|uniref:DUF4214 domain-containing protein n=1 Tax=Halomonas litopenaei TaxID=2109328 RepID=UPI003FA08D50
MADQAYLDIVQSLYVAYYGRPADPSGLQYWAERLQASEGKLGEIINAFGNSPEYTENLGSVDSPSQVNALYQQLFGRDAEEEGLNFYTNMLDSGEKSLAEIALAISEAARGSDRTTFEGRTVAANAFTQELDTQDEVDAYSTERGVDIGRAYLQRIDEQNPVDNVLDEAAPIVETLLAEGDPETPPSSGGGGGTPAPILSVNVSTANVLTFGGSATGEITVSADESANEVVFTREGASVRLSAADYVSLVTVDAGDAELSGPASLLNGTALTINSGQLTLTGVTDAMDFSGLGGNSAVVLKAADTFSGNLDVTALAGSLDITAIVLPAGGVATLTVAQHQAITLTGAYALKDTADHLAPSDTDSATADDAVTAGVDVTVTDVATLAQLAALDTANGDGALHYTTVSGTAADLQRNAATNGDAGTYVSDGKNVLVTDDISVLALDTIKAAIDSGTVTAQSIKDTAANLTEDSGDNVTVSHYVGEGTNVTIIDDETDATIAQVKAIDAQNGDGTLTYALMDTFEAILADLNDANYDYLTGASEINLETTTLGDVTVAEMQAISTLAAELYTVKDGADHVIALSNLTYDLKDTPANLASASANDILANAGSVTATEAASVSQARAIYEDDSSATYDIEDYVYNLVSNDGNSADAILQAHNLTARNTASAADATTIESRKGGTGTLDYDVADTFANLTNASYVSGVDAATDVTVSQSGSVSTSQAESVIALTNTGLTSIPRIAGNISDINTFLGANGNEEGETLRYSYYVSDSWDNVEPALDATNLVFIKGASADGVTADSVASEINIVDTIKAENAEDFWTVVNRVFSGIGDNAPTVAARTDYHVEEADITKLDDTIAGRDSIKDASTITISDTAEAIYQAQSGQDNDDIFALMDTRENDRDHITVTASSGYQKIDGTPGNDTIALGDGHDTANGFDGSDTIKGDSGNDTLNGGDGDDILEGGVGADKVNGGAGQDTIKGGSDSNADFLYGGSGRDTIFAGDSGADTTNPSSTYVNSLTGDGGGDRLYGSDSRDIFIYAGTDRDTLIDESGTTQSTRDYIENFYLGDTIDFSGVVDSNVQFFGSGSANASAVDPGTLGLSLRYEKNVQVQSWDGASVLDATRILVDIADDDGQFDDQADMHIILIGANIDVNWNGSDIVFGG